HEWLSSRQFLPGGDETVEEHYTEPGPRRRLFLEIRTRLRELIEQLPAATAEPSRPSQREVPPNPFTQTLAVREPAQFVGREAELRRLQAMLAGGSVALLGEAKIGKSSLLWQLARSWEGEVLGPIDLQGIADADDFHATLADLLDLPDGSWRGLRRALRESRALLLLDELDAGSDRCLDYEILGRLRAVCGENTAFKVVVVSRGPLREVFPDTGRGSPAYNFLVPLSVGPMKPDEVRCLLAHPWAPPAAAFDEATIDHLLAIAGGHPFKVQRVAFHRYEALTDPDYDWQAAWRQDMEHML
ncbi:MAG: ATP-binding protein, partial [bacterium]|nr:ATP-binding protein [bacterium]